ncbi:MAG: hypothetical protein IJW77_02295 [Clostridia bacterium]|nr:hypothetical protein [Clostridia bacterium]
MKQHNRDQTEDKAVLRALLMRRMDEELSTAVPDMAVVDECSALLDALEDGTLEPDRRRMKKELKKLRRHMRDRMTAAASAADEPLLVGQPVRTMRIWQRAAVCMLALLLLPCAVLFLRAWMPAWMPGTGTQTKETADMTTVGTDDILRLYDGSVTCMRGSVVSTYSDLDACMAYELPDIYYPSALPDGVVLPIIRIVGEEEDGLDIRFEFSDPRYRLQVTAQNYIIRHEGDTYLHPIDGYLYTPILSPIAGESYIAFEKTDDGLYSLMICPERDDIWYTLTAPDAASAYRLFDTMRSAESDHVHLVEEQIVAHWLDDANTRKLDIIRVCTICNAQTESEEALSACGHIWELVYDYYYDIQGVLRVAFRRQCEQCSACADSVFDTPYAELAAADRTTLAALIEEGEKELVMLFVLSEKTNDPTFVTAYADQSVRGKEWLAEAKRYMMYQMYHERSDTE